MSGVQSTAGACATAACVCEFEHTTKPAITVAPWSLPIYTHPNRAVANTYRGGTGLARPLFPTCVLISMGLKLSRMLQLLSLHALGILSTKNLKNAQAHASQSCPQSCQGVNRKCTQTTKVLTVLCSSHCALALHVNTFNKRLWQRFQRAAITQQSSLV